MDSFGFTYPARTEQFRKELRDWLAEHLTEDILAAAATPGSWNS